MAADASISQGVSDAASPRRDVEVDAEPSGRVEVDAADEADAPDPNVPPRFVEGGSFCSSQGASSVFCDDFDTADLTQEWQREGVFGKLTSYDSKSAPNDFLIEKEKIKRRK